MIQKRDRYLYFASQQKNGLSALGNERSHEIANVISAVFTVRIRNGKILFEHHGLFTNQWIATGVLEFIRQLFRNGGLDYSELYINLKTGRLMPVEILVE